MHTCTAVRVVVVLQYMSDVQVHTVVLKSWFHLTRTCISINNPKFYCTFVFTHSTLNDAFKTLYWSPSLAMG